MKNKKQAIIPNREQNGSKADKYKEKMVYGLTIDLSSLPKDIRKEIFKEILPK